MGASTDCPPATTEPTHAPVRRPRSGASRAIGATTHGIRAVPLLCSGARRNAPPDAHTGAHSQGDQVVQRARECVPGPCLAQGLRYRVATATRAPARGTTRTDRWHARLYGSRANRKNESIHRFAL